MPWSWRYEDVDAMEVAPADAPAQPPTPTQSDAESWLGENWRDLLDAGVEQVTLFEDGRTVYGPMGLRPVD